MREKKAPFGLRSVFMIDYANALRVQLDAVCHLDFSLLRFRFLLSDDCTSRSVPFVMLFATPSVPYVFNHYSSSSKTVQRIHHKLTGDS